MTQAPATPELVERLRDLTRFMTGTPRSRAMLDAADALEAQQARIAELEAERDEARGIVAWCNNSLFGSHGYFTAASGKTASEAIEDLKADSREQWRRANSAQALADRYEKALDLALDVAIGQERRLIKYGKPANELAWVIEQIRQALSSSQGRREGGEDGLPELPCGVGTSDLTDPQSQHSDGGRDV